MQSWLIDYYIGNQCIYCQGDKIYTLQDQRIKCSACGKKYSLNKLKKDIDILKLFCLEIPANRCLQETGCSYNTIKDRYAFFRQKITSFLDRNYQLENTLPSIPVASIKNKSYSNLTLAVIEQNKKVFTVATTALPSELVIHLRRLKLSGNIFLAPKFRSYANLKLYEKISANQLTKKFAISVADGFWSFAKERFHKYHGINKQNFYNYLKEMEFRFNHRQDDTFKILFNIIWPK